MITCVGLLANTLMAPPAPAGIMAALDLTRPSIEFTVDASGCGWPASQTVRKPSWPAVGTTATLNEYACAVDGTPQGLLRTGKVRVPAPGIWGPPKGPLGSR